MIKESSEKYVKNQQEITRRKRIIEHHEDKIEKIRDKSWWGDILITPIMEALKIEFPELHWDDRMSTMGFKCRVPMFGKDDNKNIRVCVTFVPKDLTKGQLAFENGTHIDDLPSGSLGDAHGFNNVDEIITDIKQVFDYVKKELKIKMIKN